MSRRPSHQDDPYRYCSRRAKCPRWGLSNDKHIARWAEPHDPVSLSSTFVPVVPVWASFLIIAANDVLSVSQCSCLLPVTIPSTSTNADKYPTSIYFMYHVPFLSSTSAPPQCTTTPTPALDFALLTLYSIIAPTLHRHYTHTGLRHITQFHWHCNLTLHTSYRLPTLHFTLQNVTPPYRNWHCPDTVAPYTISRAPNDTTTL
jgi:hypothetical protein